MKLHQLKAEAQALLEENDGVADAHAVSRWRSLARFCVRVGRGFVQNRCPVRAAALAFTTVLALVPMLAVVLSVSTAFVQKDAAQLREWVSITIEKTAPQLKDIKGIETAIDTIFQSIENFKSGSLGITAVLALIFVAISLLGSIEATFNDIWGATRGRSWSARIVQYWAAITLGPMLLLAAAGVTTSSQMPKFKGFLEKLATDYHLGFVAELVNFSISYLLPFVILSIAMMALYLLLPNTKVHWRAALLGGLVAGAAVQLNSMSNILYASRVAREKSIYGSLAAGPLFLMGLYLSWIIVLLGAQVAFTFQNRRAHLLERQTEALDQRGREFLGLRLMTWIGQRFQAGKPAPGASAIAEVLGLPLRLVSQILTPLVQANLLVEVAGPEKTFVPARPLARISAYDVLRALREGNRSGLPSSPDVARSILSDEFEHIESAFQEAASGVTLQVLVDRSLAASTSSPLTGR